MTKKKTYGVEVKPKAERAIDEINKDYNQNAAECGHKQRIIWQLQNEVDVHIQSMCDLNSEAARAQKALKEAPPVEAPKPAEEVKTEAPV